MIFHQFRDPVSDTLTYILAKSKGSEALIIDPVADRVDDYLKFLGENELRLVKALDTHIHADHISGLSKLRKMLKCITIMGNECQADLVSMRVSDGDLIKIDGVTLRAIHTPGHTDESYCYYMEGMVFTGDTLMIRGTGRTDFQNGDASLHYDSITKKLFTLPDSTVVFPGHDYKGESLSTIGLEKKLNPRLVGKSKEDYIELMNGLNLANPKMMDVAVPANTSLGKDINDNIANEMILTSKVACDEYFGKKDHFFVDLRELEEIDKTGVVEGSIQLPYQNLESALADENSELVQKLNKNQVPIFYCAYGERSALALEITLSKGDFKCFHVKDGIAGWMNSNNNKHIK